MVLYHLQFVYDGKFSEYVGFMKLFNVSEEKKKVQLLQKVVAVQNSFL